MVAKQKCYWKSPTSWIEHVLNNHQPETSLKILKWRMYKKNFNFGTVRVLSLHYLCWLEWEKYQVSKKSKLRDHHKPSHKYSFPRTTWFTLRFIQYTKNKYRKKNNKAVSIYLFTIIFILWTKQVKITQSRSEIKNVYLRIHRRSRD